MEIAAVGYHEGAESGAAEGSLNYFGKLKEQILLGPFTEPGNAVFANLTEYEISIYFADHRYLLMQEQICQKSLVGLTRRPTAGAITLTYLLTYSQTDFRIPYSAEIHVVVPQ